MRGGGSVTLQLFGFQVRSPPLLYAISEVSERSVYEEDFSKLIFFVIKQI